MIYIIAGTRPNFVKIAPLIWEFKRRGFSGYKVIHTGQHYDYAMSKIFFEELGLNQPDYYLNVGSGTRIQQVSRVADRLDKLFFKKRPDKMVVVGDVNSTLGAALAGAFHKIPIAHIEAGLRSFDDIPEEMNRVLTDRLSDLLFISERSGVVNLLEEGLRGKLVGNIMIDTLIAKRDKFIDAPYSDYILVTLHRPENVDREEDLREIADLLNSIDEKLIFPMHPRTRERLDEYKIKLDVKIIEPQGYLSFMGLLENAEVVITDSGGVQEESTFLGVPCITLRNSTERPITVEVGTNQLCGRDYNQITDCLDNPKTGGIPELWDGNTAKRIAEYLI
jgi:UDP-N-acetylglucosamine 2-epimerase (non-hydrolysing)